MKPEQQADDCNVICPFCGHSYQPESADYSENEVEENCDECGRSFVRWTEFSVIHHTKPITSDPEDPRCPQCDGTGEGCADGVRCSTCNGKGY